MYKRSFSAGNPSSLQLNSTLSACDARRALVAKRRSIHLKTKRKNAATFSVKINDYLIFFVFTM